MIRKVDKQAQSYCSSVFVEPIAWMTEILEGNRMGSLLCPKCKQKVGHFDWAGLQVRFINLSITLAVLILLALAGGLCKDDVVLIC